MSDTIVKAIAEAISVLTGLIFLSIVVTKLVDWFIKPFFTKYNLDIWWLTYVAGVIGGVIGWFTEANAFAAFMPNALWLGRILTTLAFAGGPVLLHDITKDGDAARLPMTPQQVAAKKATKNNL